MVVVVVVVVVFVGVEGVRIIVESGGGGLLSCMGMIYFSVSFR